MPPNNILGGPITTVNTAHFDWNPFTCWFNPFTAPTAPACKISRLKSVHTHASKQYTWRSYNYCQYCTFWLKSFHILKRRGQKRLNSFRSGTFIGRLLSDGVASTAAKELRQDGGHQQFGVRWFRTALFAWILTWIVFWKADKLTRLDKYSLVDQKQISGKGDYPQTLQVLSCPNK